MFTRIISVILTVVFITTQCGLGFAAEKNRNIKTAAAGAAQAEAKVTDVANVAVGAALAARSSAAAGTVGVASGAQVNTNGAGEQPAASEAAASGADQQVFEDELIWLISAGIPGPHKP